MENVRVKEREVRTSGKGLGLREFLNKLFGQDGIEDSELQDEVRYIQSQDNVETIEASVGNDNRVEIEEGKVSFRERQRLANSGGGGNAKNRKTTTKQRRKTR